MSKNRAIGKNNQLPWHLSDDLKLFKRLTLDKHVIMGRKCFDSIGHPLPKRKNIILTRNPFFLVTNALTVNSLEEALTIALDNGEEEAMILGGTQIYELAMPYLDKIYLTEVDAEVDGDTFFPELDKNEWEEEVVRHYKADENNDYDFTFKILHRIGNSRHPEEGQGQAGKEEE